MKFTIRFRGTVAILPLREKGPVRFMLLNGEYPSMAGMSRDTMIPTHYPYLAIPENLRTTVFHPKFVRPPIKHDGAAGPESEDETHGGTSPHQKIFVLGHHKIEIPELNPTTGTLTIPATANIADMQQIRSKSSSVDPLFLGPSPPLDKCAAFLDLNAGSITSMVNLKHNFRFIYGDIDAATKKTRQMQLAHEVGVTATGLKGVTIIITDREPRSTLKETIHCTTDTEIILGNEPLDDIVALGPLRHCADPGCHFQLYFSLSQNKPDPPFTPAPICIVDHPEHRDPPETRCNPPTVMR